ncbi:hypothetical protein [Streptacidiphilus anmyonensis]|uniref:hypothetical protein n=1 Tax=Streptacidiphilus anmyonensis TaxID=405782 RepID=UPI0005A88D12|nr:hypothetical protein [Streptacidiphilus anmyonensis]
MTVIRALKTTAAILAATALASLPTTAVGRPRAADIPTVNLRIIVAGSAIVRLNLDYGEGGDFPKTISVDHRETQTTIRGVGVAIYSDRFGGKITIAEDAITPDRDPICVNEGTPYRCLGTMEVPAFPGRQPTVIIF